MNKYTGKVPAVIDEQMIVESLEDSHKYQHADQDFLNDVTSLNLAYKNILKISNIWYLRNLTKLQLNNNLIEKVEGLTELTNLVWLDLSFNNIEKIEGMDSLTKLRDLSLFNNNIEKLENMDALTNLQLLSVGNNNIKDFSNIIYLRRFKALNSLTLEGNPLSTSENYKSYTIALLSCLVYLDYSVIDENTKEDARHMYEMDIEKLEDSDAEADILQRSSKENFLALEKQEAFVDKVKGSFILEVMFANDEEGKLLSNIPPNKTALDEYFKSLNLCCEQLYQYGMKVYAERQNEISEFEKFLAETRQRSKEQATIEINKFTSSQSRALHNLLLNSNTKDELDGEKIEDLKMALLLLEVQLVDQVEESMKEFSQNLSEIINDFIDQVRFRLQECRHLESIYYHKILSEIATSSGEVLTNKMDEFLAQNLANILVDKDSLQSSAKSSHEMHIQILENLEDEIASKSNTWMKNYMENIQNDEILRNRSRTLEIIHLIDSLQEDFHVAEP